MIIMKENASEILNIARNIYLMQEGNNPNVIFGERTFLIGTEEDPEKVIVQRNYENKDRSYYFESPEIEGAIIKRGNGNYCVKACVSYIGANNQVLHFAKIRIENSFDGDIKIMGTWGGSWEQPDFDDEDQLKNPNPALPMALCSMRSHLTDIYSQLRESYEEKKDSYDPTWVKKLKKDNK